jgi:hypothetical protein
VPCIFITALAPLDDLDLEDTVGDLSERRPAHGERCDDEDRGQTKSADGPWEPLKVTQLLLPDTHVSCSPDSNTERSVCFHFRES